MTAAPALLVLDALAVFRLTRLVLNDSITAPARQSITSRGPDWVLTLLTCPWCMSFWLAILVVVLQTTVPSQWLYASAVLAFSAVAGLLDRLA